VLTAKHLSFPKYFFVTELVLLLCVPFMLRFDAPGGIPNHGHFLGKPYHIKGVIGEIGALAGEHNAR
jgi:hypothetical protein